MALHIPWYHRDSTLCYPFGLLYKEPLGYIEEEELKRKEAIVHYFLKFSYTWVYIPLSLWSTLCSCQVLWREIAMAWGTITDSLTPEINPFLYARETKYITLKDLDLYLILDGWCRSRLSFPTPARIDKLLPQCSINNKSMLYINVLDLL